MFSLIAEVRDYLRDYRELNTLITGEEHSDRNIGWAILDTLTEFNSTPPRLSVQYTLNNFPDRVLLKKGAIYQLVQQVSFLMTRNLVSFSDGGISVSMDHKVNMLMQMARWLYEEYNMRVANLKRALNIELMMTGGTGSYSEYLMVNAMYGLFLDPSYYNGGVLTVTS